MKKHIEISKEEEERALELHRKAIIVDGMSMFCVVEDEDYFRKVQSGGVDATVVDILVPSIPRGYHSVNNFLNTVRTLDKMYSKLKENPSMLLAKNVEDIKKAKKQGKVAIIPGMQDGKPFLEVDLTLPPYDLSLLRVLYMLGVRMVEPVQNQRNALADGCNERTNCGLSAFGIKWVEEMDQLGMLIDCTHAGDKTTLDCIDMSKNPIVLSHSNARSVCDNARNATDEMIIALSKKGGVIGVCPFPLFVSWKPNPTLEDLLNHVDYIVNLVGVDHVGIGLDHIEAYTDEEKRSLLVRCPEIWGTEEQWGDYAIESVTKLPDFTKGLVARGYSDQEILKILGGNFLRVFEKVFR